MAARVTSLLEAADVGASRQEGGGSCQAPPSVAFGDVFPSKGEIGSALLSKTLIFRKGAFSQGHRMLAAETAVAITFNGSTHAVLMATPADLEDFAIGFALTERIIENAQAIDAIDIVETPLGLDLQVRLTDDVATRLAARRRSMAGPAGCGLCGVESLEAAMRDVPTVMAEVMFAPSDIANAVAELARHQPLNAETRAVHAAGFFRPGSGTVVVREDVGRHNALDKLVGALARAGSDASGGAVVLTSRVSIEMVQKAAVAGAGLIIAVSAPTALAVQTAAAAGITLVAVARGDEFEVFTHPARITTGATSHAA